MIIRLEKAKPTKGYRHHVEKTPVAMRSTSRKAVLKIMQLTKLVNSFTQRKYKPAAADCWHCALRREMRYDWGIDPKGSCYEANSLVGAVLR
ncbi:hypothetical protein [Paramixta manurensis]|uniref:hypothetical protein n=1 Tax=Paramixta manurensis TaxID=2740817 RepID=UPI00156A7478